MITGPFRGTFARPWQSSLTQRRITGGTRVFAAYPSWRAGGGSQATASSYCGTTGFTGGPIKYSQYASGGYDADVRCF
jgi:hypothetical protein